MAAKCPFSKSKFDSTLGGGKAFFSVTLKNADLDFNHLQRQHNALTTSLPVGPLLNPSQPCTYAITGQALGSQEETHSPAWRSVGGLHHASNGEFCTLAFVFASVIVKFPQTSHITKPMGHPRKALVPASEAPALWPSRRSGWLHPEGQPGLGPGRPSAGVPGCSWPAGNSLSKTAPVDLTGLPRPGAGRRGARAMPICSSPARTQDSSEGPGHTAWWAARVPCKRVPLEGEPATALPPASGAHSQPRPHAQRGRQRLRGLHSLRARCRCLPQQAWGPRPGQAPRALSFHRGSPQGVTVTHGADVRRLSEQTLLPEPCPTFPPDVPQRCPPAPHAQASPGAKGGSDRPVPGAHCTALACTPPRHRRAPGEPGGVTHQPCR